MKTGSLRNIVGAYPFRAVLLLIIVAFLSASGWLERLDWMIYDRIISVQSFQPDSDIVIVAIDDESLQALGQWPWSRKLHARLLNRLSQSGWNVVALDLLLSEPDTTHPRADDRLGAAIFSHGNVVLPVAPARTASEYLFTLIQPLASLRRHATAGHVDIELDRDGVVRRIFLYAGIDTPAFPALGLVLAGKSSSANQMNTRNRLSGGGETPANTGNFWVRTNEVLVPFAGPPGTYPRISYAQLLKDDTLLAGLRDKIIIIGMTATGLQPGFLTPVSVMQHHYMSGVEWHANVVDMLRNGRSIHPAADGVAVLTAVLWVLAALIAVNAVPGRSAGFMLAALLVAGIVLVAVSLKIFHVWLPPGAGIVGILAAYPLFNWQRINEFIQSQFITGTYLQAVFDSVWEGVITTDARYRILYLNRESERILGIRSARLIGKPLDQVLGVCLIPDWRNESNESSNTPAGKGTADTKSRPHLQHCTLKVPFGEDRTIRVAHRSLHGKHKELIGAVITISDISDALEMKRQIAHQANYDALTLLPNRTFLLSRLSALINSARQNGAILTACLISIDNFKKINDALGYHAGDALLKMIADRLLKLAFGEDVIARWGGDEFMLISGRLSQEDQAPPFAKKILDTLGYRFDIHGQEVFLSASVGISVSSRADEEDEVMLDQAVIATQRVKQQGGNGFRFYSVERSDIWTREQLEFEKDFRHAIENKDKALHVLFQPIIDIRQQRTVRAEVLVRWIHPQRGLLLPGEFIPLAERVGLVEQLGDLVLWMACRTASDLAKVGQPVNISVNVAARQLLHADFLQKVADVLAATDLPTRRLVLEITESAIISDLPRAAEVLGRLKEMGITIALDDFGTGYSSLSLLRELPIDILKIDKSFIQGTGNDDLGHEKFDFAIVRAIIALGDNLGLSVIAEGVETRKHMEFLRRHNCYLQQGYYFSHPLSTTQFMRFISKHHSPQQETAIITPRNP